MDIGTGLMMIPTLDICCRLHPPFVTQFRHPHTINGEGICKSTFGVGGRIRSCVGDTLPSGPESFLVYPCLAYLPVLVRTIMALAQHLKADSTAPTATTSEGSLVRWECLLSSSNSCLWKVAASASRAIWAQRDHEGRVGWWGYSRITHYCTPSHSHHWVTGKCVARLMVKL